MLGSPANADKRAACHGGATAHALPLDLECAANVHRGIVDLGRGSRPFSLVHRSEIANDAAFGVI
jgi:hypothetical protein